MHDSRTITVASGRLILSQGSPLSGDLREINAIRKFVSLFQSGHFEAIKLFGVENVYRS